MTRPLARTEDLLSEEVSGECVIYDRRRRKAHNLNSTLTWIWHRCDGQSSIAEIASAFEGQFDVRDGLSAVVTGLKQLEACSLLESQLEAAEFAHAVSVSRRSVVAGGSILLPALVSVLAPTPAAAKSKPDDSGGDPGHGDPGQGDPGNGKHKGRGW